MNVRQIHHAAQNLVDLDMALVDAVLARIELDLRIGASFTRMQSFALRAKFPSLESTISYGKFHVELFVF